MLSIFNPKTFLVDIFNDFTDIHNHILPGIDDGSKTPEESLVMIKRMIDLGITQFICTPHTMNDYYPNTPSTITNAQAILKKKLDEANLASVRIDASSEYMMDSSFLELLRKGTILPLKDKFILVEMSFFHSPINLEEIIFEITSKGFIPVLAHPERYGYLHHKPDYYKTLIGKGCKMQLNTLSLTAHYGKHVKKMAEKMLNEHLFDYIATDTHHQDHVEKLSGIKIKTKLLYKIESIVENTKNTFSYK